MTRPRPLELGIGAVVLIGLVWAASRVLNGGEVWSALARLEWTVVLGVTLLGVVYTALKGLRFVRLARAVSGLPRPVLTRLYWAGEAASLLPGGVALRVAMLAQQGVSPARGSVPVLLSSGWDQVGFGLCTALLLLTVPAARSFVGGGGWLLSLIVLVPLIPGVRRATERLLRRLLAERGLEFWDALRSSLVPREVVWALGLTLLSLGIKVLALALALAGLTLSVPLATVAAAVILPTAAGRLLPTPGGIGPTEAGMVLLLGHAGVPSESALVVAVLYRAALVFIPALIGGVIYLLFWRPHRASDSDLQHQRG